MRKIKLFFGMLFIIFGAILMFSNAFRIMGYAVYESGGGHKIYFAGAVLMVLGVLVLMFGREKSRWGGLEIMISRKAIERVKKDKTAEGYLDKYANEIEQIAKHPEVREKGYHAIGEFRMSPTGHRPIRVAWHYDKNTNTLYVDDVLYKTGQKRYVDRWDEKVSKREITLADYEKKGYVRYKTPGQIEKSA